MRVVFFPVHTPVEKLKRLAQVADVHFKKADPLLFFVPDETAWKFVNELLWKLPPASFLPHPSKLLHIRLQLDAQVGTVFNLTPVALPSGCCKVVYEFEDATSPEKERLAKARYESYKGFGCPISVET